MKSNKSVLIASISGIVVCIVCVGLLFLLAPKGNNNEIRITENNDEISLGESSCRTTYSCASGLTKVGTSDCCDFIIDDLPNAQECSSVGGTLKGGKCWQACYSATTSKYCDCWYAESGGKTCRQVEVQTSSCSGIYTDSASSCHSKMSCSSTEYINNNQCTSCGTGMKARTQNCDSSKADCCIPEEKKDCWYVDDGDRNCEKVELNVTTCPSGYYSETECYNRLSCGSNEYINNNGACQSCGSKVLKSSKCHGSESECCESKSACPAAYPNYSSTVGKCYKSVSAGHYVSNESTGQVSSCDAGFWMIEHNAYADTADRCASCPDGQYSATGASKCSNCSELTGKSYCTSSHTVAICNGNVNDDHTSCDNDESISIECPMAIKVGTSGSCTLNASSGVTISTINISDSKVLTASKSSNIVISINGKALGTAKITVRASNNKTAEAVVSVTSDASSSTSCTIKFKTADGSSNITSCKTLDSGSISRTCIPVNTCVSWSIVECNGKDCSNQTKIGYDDIINNKCNITTYYCLGGSSVHPTSTPVPTPTPTPKISRCYIDSDNNYHWTSSPEPSWKIAKDDDGNEITNKDLCPPKDACYIDSNGEYIWGEYSAKPGYTYVSEITDKDSCKKDETYACYRMDSEYSCYKKDSDYVLAKQAPEGYTKEDDKSKCGNEYIWSKEDKTGYEKTGLPYNKCENPACYYYEKDNKRVWGYYSKINGYYLLVDENDIPLPQDQCRNDMCYKDPDGDYVWGDHEDEEGFTPLPEITEISECGPEVPTPKTDINVSRVVYVFIAILMVSGIGFIYYSTIMKKDN